MGLREGGRPGGPEDPLARSFRLGEAAALTEVEGVISRIVRHRGYYIPAHDQEELVQDVIALVWQMLSRPEFTRVRNLRAFVQSIACRRCVDWMRRLRATEPVSPSMEDGGATPDHRYLARERLDLGRRILASLRARCRELIRMFVLEELSYREIASRLGRSEGALRTQMSECLGQARALRERLMRGVEGNL